jgi:hypothetical protein
MAEQSQSSYALQGTAPSGAIFETPIARIGRGGLQLNKALDDLTMEELSRLSNLYHTGAELTTRLGQTYYTGFGGTVHSIRRLNDPRHATFTRFWGAGTAWYRGTESIGFTQLDTGFSGNPLTFLPVRPPFSGEPWMIAADTNAMRKASSSGLSLPLGLSVPTGLTTSLSGAQTLPVAAFNSSDGTQAATWQVFNGYAPDHLTTLAFGASLVDTPGVNGSGVLLQTINANSAPTVTLIVGMGVPFSNARDFSHFTVGGTSAITDDDLLHLALKLDFPLWISEIRVYFVCSPFVMPQTSSGVGAASTWSLPGMGVGSFSPSAYLLTLRPSDYTNALLAAETFQTAADRVRTATFLETFTDPVAAAIAAAPSAEASAGAGVWSLFSGVITGSDGKTYQLPPIRRGDLAKIGTAGQQGSDWTSITGMYITVSSITPDLSAKLASGGLTIDAALNDLYFTGGSGPDTTELGSQKFDYRVTNYDPRTGARSNGSVIQTGAPGAAAATPDATLDAARQPITITPNAYVTDPAILQEAYRRGGVLNDNWYFVAVNTANGAPITDTFDDTSLLNVATLPLTNFQPVSTVDNAGNTILAQPLPIVFGPFDDGTLCGLGDPYRPGYLYASVAGQPDHWPSTGGYAVEVCSPSEELMNGTLIGGSGFVLSRERGYTAYTNLAGGTGIVATPSGCVPGLAARWGFCKGPGGVFYVARDGIRVTTGADSVLLSDHIRPLFHAETKNGYLPIDFSVPTAIRLEVYDLDLYFLYQDTGATRQCLVYSLLYRYWRAYNFARPVAAVYSDETQTTQQLQGDQQLFMGSSNGNAYLHSGFTDDAAAITYQARTGAWHWNHPREEKLLGDLVVEANLQGTTLTAQTFLNTEAVANTAQTVIGGIGRTRLLFDPFGTTPQHARNVSIDFSGSAGAAASAQITLAFAGLSFLIQPEVTMNRVTSWEAIRPTESYLYACCIDCDTGGTPRTILVEYDLAGVTSVAATLTVSANGRHKLWFSWPAVHAQLVRLRPIGACQPWMVWNVDWIGQEEPPRIAGWDTNFEDLGDSYYTGLDLELDTFGVTKTIQVFADQVPIGGTITLNASGRTHAHIALPPGRAHIYRFVATDANPGLLYNHKWIVEAEPLEQFHWNAAYTVWDSLSDKYLKGIILEVDTFGLAKSVNVEVDQVVLATFTVTTSGRTVTNITFPQVLGRVFRIIPTDTNKSRLYTAQPIFDEEPFALGRWEGQIHDFDLPNSGWGSILSMDCCYRATAACTLTFDVYDATGRLLQTITGQDQALGTATLPATSGAKQKRYVVFPPNKGVLFKPVLTSANGSGVTLYKEESRLRIQPWSGGGAMSKLLGNDDLMPTRQMTKAAVAAGRQGGGAR